MTKNSVCHTPYLKNHTSCDCDFWYTCVKWYLQQIFSFFKILIFGVCRGKRAKNDLKLPISVCFALCLRNCRSYHQDFDNDIYRCFSLYFLKKCNIVNIKIILFLLAHFKIRLLTWLTRSLYFSFWVSNMSYCVQRTSSQKILCKLLLPLQIFIQIDFYLFRFVWRDFKTE